jgi:hypothetical protein
MLTFDVLIFGVTYQSDFCHDTISLTSATIPIVDQPIPGLPLAASAQELSVGNQFSSDNANADTHRQIPLVSQFLVRAVLKLMEFEFSESHLELKNYIDINYSQSSQTAMLIEELVRRSPQAES